MSCILRWFGWRLVVFSLMVVASVASSTSQAAISWDGGGNSNWWFNPVNWSQDAALGGPYLPPAQDDTATPAEVPVFTDAQVNVGTGAWDATGEGVVYDPVNDPFFANAGNLQYPTGSPLATTAGFMRDYGPETLYRWYVSRNTLNHNLVTIKSGDLVIESTTVIGRSGSTGTLPEQQNLGMVRQLGGSVRFALTNLDMGNREASGWGNGIWDYRAGILEVGLGGGGTGTGLRLAAGGSAGTGGHGRLIMHNPASGGRVRSFVFNVAANAGVAGNPAISANGVTNGVGIVEFHFENGGTRPIQVVNTLFINNGLVANGTRSARLDLRLDAAPTVIAEVPQNLGLFDVDAFSDDFWSGSIAGDGDLGVTGVGR